MPKELTVWLIATGLICAFVMGISTEVPEHSGGTPAVAGALITWGLVSLACAFYALGRHGRR